MLLMKQKFPFFSKEFRIRVFGAGWGFYVLLTGLGLFLLTFLSREADEISNGRKGKQVIFRSKTYFTGHGERQKEVLLFGH